MKSVLLILFAMLTVACEPVQYSQPATPSSYSGEAGHSAGLSETLEDAPSAYAAEVMTKFYNLGYSIGRVEGTEVRFKSEDRFREMGCVAILPQVLERVTGSFAGLSTCQALVRSEYTEATFAGARFSRGRLLTSQKGAETGDSRITAMLLRAYENGYAMGFKQSHDENNPLADLRTAATQGCLTHVRRYPEAFELVSRCEQIGQETVTEYLQQLDRVKSSR